LVFSRSSFQKLFGFSSKLLLAGLSAAIFNNIYAILIGKLFAPKEVGFYTRGKQFPELISSTLTSILKGVTYPILTSLQNERERMVQVYGKLMRITVFVVIPVLTLFALLAEPFVRLFLTEKWMPIVPLIQWLCFARMITPISGLNMNILNAIGRSDLFLKVDLSKMPMMILALIITVPMGLKAVVIGNFITTVISFFINTYYPGKIFGYGAKRQLVEMKSVLMAALVMSGSVLLINHFLQGDLIKLLAGTIVAFISYFSVAHLMKMEELTEIKKVALEVINKKFVGNKIPK
jgi:O-antigen/teichoic acid export membrane protein